MGKQSYAGSCHCGRIRFEVTTDLTRASQCNCSLCAKKGYVHHMVTPEDFRLLAGAGNLATYQFGTMTARHHFLPSLRRCALYSTSIISGELHSQRPVPRRR